MRTPIGEMREMARVLTPTTTKDAAGGEVNTYAEGSPIFVALRPASAREAIQFGQVNAEVSHVLFGHWHDLNALQSTARIRLIESGAEFDVVGPPMNDPQRAWTRLNVVQRENA